MKNNCKICGARCKSKYCSDECAKEALRINRRRKYREKHPAFENFYVFYDKDDFVKCCGSVEQLIDDGFFPSANAIRTRVSRIKSDEIVNGNVYVLRCKK